MNVANGDFRSVEPYTQTGSIFYPRAYYQGHRPARAPHAQRPGGLVVDRQPGVAGAAGRHRSGAASAAFTGRRWLAVLGPLALTAGVFGELRGTGWLTHLHQHAVIWGPFAEFFAGNGATVAVARGGAVPARPSSGW